MVLQDTNGDRCVLGIKVDFEEKNMFIWNNYIRSLPANNIIIIKLLFVFTEISHFLHIFNWSRKQKNRKWFEQTLFFKKTRNNLLHCCVCVCMCVLVVLHFYLIDWWLMWICVSITKSISNQMNETEKRWHFESLFTM